MELRDWITCIALLLGPLLAVGLTLYAQKRSQMRNQRIYVFQTLLAYRQDLFNVERIKALCLIDIVFHSVPRVRAKWKEYFDALSDPQFKDGQNDAVNVWARKQSVMIAEMANALGYGKEIGIEEISRSYSPKQYEMNASMNLSMQNELLRILKNSEHFGVQRKN